MKLLQMPMQIVSFQAPPQLLSTLAVNHPSSNSSGLLEGLTELRDMFTILLKGLIKHTDEEPGEEMHGLRSGRVLSAEAFVPVVMEIHHPPGVTVFTSLEAH